MTVSYQYDVASSTSGGFTRLLFKWKGSLYKLVWRELFIFLFIYASTSVLYRHVFSEDQKRTFEQVVNYCNTFMNYIPLSFILGFYVSFVASRWWQQYMAIPWPDKILHAIALHVNGYDEKSRILRRTMVRYLNLSLVLILRSISSAVKKRFPTLEHLVEAGFVTTTELEIYKTVPSTEFNTYWIPCTWFTALIKEARAQKRITDPMGVKHIMEEFNIIREKCGMLWSYDWVSIPLVYTQVVTLATYCFFLACIIGRQYVDEEKYKRIDLYVPYFTLLQFFFYMGLLKVAEQLINPFGDDDEDFELNWIIDRHMKVSYLIVDTLLLRTPPLTKDIFFDEASPVLPYTEASATFKKRTYRGSVANMVVPEEKQNLILPDIQEEFEDEGGGSNLLSSKRSSSTNIAGSMRSVSSMRSVRSLVRQSSIKRTREAVYPITVTRPIERNFSFDSFLETEEEGNGRDKSRLHVSTDHLAPETVATTPTSNRSHRGSITPLSQQGSQRAGSAGSKGQHSDYLRPSTIIERALLAAGANQSAFARSTPEIVTSATDTSTSNSNSAPVIDHGAMGIEQLLNQATTQEDLDYIISPFAAWGKEDQMDDVVMYEDETSDKYKKGIHKSGSFHLKTSIKAKMGIKKKPVITWRPYIRPGTSNIDRILPGDEKLIMQSPSQESNETVPGVFEDECAFMWRTIEDVDSDSQMTPLPNLMDEKRTNYYDQYDFSNSNSESPKPRRTPSIARFSIPNRNGVESVGYTVAARRLRHRARWRPRYCSLQQLSSSSSCNQSVINKVVRSLSENSVFIDLVAQHLSKHKKSTEILEVKKPNVHTPRLAQLRVSKPKVNGKKYCSSSSISQLP